MASASFSVLRLMWPLITSRHKCCKDRGLPGGAQTHIQVFSCLLDFASCIFFFKHSGWNWSFTQRVRDVLPLGQALQDAFEVWTDPDMADIVQERGHHTANQMFQPCHWDKLTELKERKSLVWFIVALMAPDGLIGVFVDSIYVCLSELDLTVMTLGWLYIW